MSPADAAELLRRIGGGDGEIMPIAEAALAYAALHRPGLQLEAYQEHLTILAEAVQAVAAVALVERADALRQVLGDQFGYRGAALRCSDMDDSDLAHVMDRKRGLAVALAILYIATARAQGWQAFGVNFPGHFLVMLIDGTEQLLIDPYEGGLPCNRARLEIFLQDIRSDAADLPGLVQSNAAEPPVELKPEHCRPISDRDLLLRLQNDIKLRLLVADQPESALVVIERMLILAPNSSLLWDELAQVNVMLRRLQGALEAAKQALARAVSAAERERAAGVLHRLRKLIN